MEMGWACSHTRTHAHTQNARKQLQVSFTKGAKMMHREITDKCISVHKLENQVNNTWNMKMIYRSNWHLGKEVQPKTCSSPTVKMLEARCLPLRSKENTGNVTKIITRDHQSNAELNLLHKNELKIMVTNQVTKSENSFMLYSQQKAVILFVMTVHHFVHIHLICNHTAIQLAWKATCSPNPVISYYQGKLQNAKKWQ
jgi:hypothetical protein